jgi:hypothetical protein
MYAATIAARQSQFGSTVIEWNLTDDAGSMPTQRVAIKLRTENPAPAQVRDARDAAVTRATAIFIEANQRRIDQEALRSQLSGFIGQKMEQVRAEFAARIEASSLTAEQKELARGMVPDWRLE